MRRQSTGKCPAETARAHGVVLDDLLDGGRPCAPAATAARAGAQKVWLRCCWRRLGRAKPITADFVGLRIPDRFVFGCGMDAKGYWRNLPDIRAIRGL